MQTLFRAVAKTVNKSQAFFKDFDSSDCRLKTKKENFNCISETPRDNLIHLPKP